MIYIKALLQHKIVFFISQMRYFPNLLHCKELELCNVSMLNNGSILKKRRNTINGNEKQSTISVSIQHRGLFATHAQL